MIILVIIKNKVNNVKKANDISALNIKSSFCMLHFICKFKKYTLIAFTSVKMH